MNDDDPNDDSYSRRQELPPDEHANEALCFFVFFFCSLFLILCLVFLCFLLLSCFLG